MNATATLAKTACCLLLALLVIDDRTAAGWSFYDSIEILHPKTYRSKSGECELTVDPSHRYGEGEATYRFTKNEFELWSATLPFTLWNAGVTDNGIVIGYAYTRFPDAFSDPGKFLVVILDPAGKILLKESVQRQPSQFLHSSATPIAEGLILDEANDRAIVRVADADLNRGEEAWWIYELSTACEIEKLSPASHMANASAARSILDVQPIHDTPLMLVHWWRYDPNVRDAKVGARFTLIDLKAKPVWTLELPEDYSIPGNKEAEGELQSLIRKRGGVLDTSQPNQFDLYFAAKSQQVTFSVKRNSAGAWKVAETARKPFTLKDEVKPEPPEIPERPLKSLGTIKLESASNRLESPFHSIGNFTFDDRGRIAFVRDEGDADQAVFVLFDQSGKLLREIPLKLDVKPDSGWSDYCWVGGSRYVIANSPDVDSKARAWWIDVATGKLEPITRFASPTVERLIGFADGSFVALATAHEQHTIETSIIGFNPHGQPTWTIKEDSNDESPGGLLNIEDIAATTNSEIAALDNSRRVVKFFDRNGKFLRKIDLEKAWGRTPRYPSTIAADADGGVLIEDFHGLPPFVRMRGNGKVRAGIAPKFADGRAVDASDRMQTSPDGRLWVCDGEALYRLTDEGVVDFAIGEPPDQNKLGRIAGINIDDKGQIYAVDCRTGSIHICDPTGKLIRICKTKPTDFAGQVFDAKVAVDDRGDIYLGLGNGIEGPDDARQFARFASQGVRAGEVTFPAKQCYFHPGTGKLLAMRYEEVLLNDRDGKTIRTLRRRPDGNWLDPHTIAIAPGGSIAVIEASTSMKTSANLYEANGDPIRTFALPDEMCFCNVAYDGKWVILGNHNGVMLFDVSGRPLLKLPLPVKPGAEMFDWQPLITAGGRELLLFDGRSSILYRYQLP